MFIYIGFIYYKYLSVIMNIIVKGRDITVTVIGVIVVIVVFIAMNIIIVGVINTLKYHY